MSRNEWMAVPVALIFFLLYQVHHYSLSWLDHGYLEWCLVLAEQCRQLKGSGAALLISAPVAMIVALILALLIAHRWVRWGVPAVALVYALSVLGYFALL